MQHVEVKVVCEVEVTEEVIVDAIVKCIAEGEVEVTEQGLVEAKVESKWMVKLRLLRKLSEGCSGLYSGGFSKCQSGREIAVDGIVDNIVEVVS